MQREWAVDHGHPYASIITNAHAPSSEQANHAITVANKTTTHPSLHQPLPRARSAFHARKS
jgi:hypothetical protein